MTYHYAMPPFGNMGQMGMQGMPGESETNLLSIILNAAFGFVAGLVYLFGLQEVIAYGSELAASIIKTTGAGQQMGPYGGFIAAAPYIVLAPLVGLVAKQLSSVRSLKSFAYFVLAVAGGFAIAFVTQSYFSTLIAA